MRARYPLEGSSLVQLVIGILVLNTTYITEVRRERDNEVS